MTLGALLHLLCVFGVFQKGLTDLIQTQRTVTAAAGEEARLSCQLVQFKDVVQVTWQKVLPGREETLVTYTTTYGERVNPDFKDKVEFADAGLQSSSIIIRNVTEQDEGCYHCLFNADPEGALIGTTCLQVYGLTDLIRTQPTVMAAVGDEALLNCELMQFKEVVKVIWWKILPNGMRNIISQHKEYGQDVNPDFRDKVEFADAGLQSSSIIIRNVAEQDEGCYCCLFNIDPGIDLKATTCLQLFELHEPVLHVGDSNSEETVVSCSATGRPAPTVTLTVLRDNVHFSETSSVSVSNTNGTVTVTSTAVLTRLRNMETEVRCAVRVLSGPQKEKIMMIPAEVKQSADGFSEDSGSEITAFTRITTLSVVLFICCVAAAVTVLLIRKHRNSLRQRDSEEINTPQETTEHTQETDTPVMCQENEQLRKRTPPEEDEGSD